MRSRQERQSAAWWCGLGLFLASLAGCQRDPSGVGPTVPVAGSVRVAGKPLTSGMVIFRPDTAKGNHSRHEPRSPLDGQGNYRLTTAGKDGAPPGWYKVAVVAEKGRDPGDPQGGHGHAPPVWVLPLKYIDPEKSGLTCEATANPLPGAYDFQITP